MRIGKGHICPLFFCCKNSIMYLLLHTSSHTSLRPWPATVACTGRGLSSVAKEKGSSILHNNCGLDLNLPSLEFQQVVLQVAGHYRLLHDNNNYYNCINVFYYKQAKQVLLALNSILKS